MARKQKCPATSVLQFTKSTSDKQRLEAFASSLLTLETPRISKEIDEHIMSVLNGAVEELQWIADELENMEGEGEG